MDPVTLQVPLQIPSQNQTGRGRTWRARAGSTKRLRAAWCAWTAMEMRAKGLPIATGPRRIHVVAYRTQRCSDIANLIGGAKACVDGMVDAGLLVDDRDALALITYEQAVASKSPTKRPHTTITVTINEETP